MEEALQHPGTGEPLGLLVEVEEPNPLLVQALEYADRGYKVFPLSPRGKTPLTLHGFKEGTTNNRQIIDWWERWPDANIGIATGRASGIVVIDVDGEDGYGSLRELEARYGPLRETARVLTGGGGEHLVFQWPGRAVANSARKVAAGIDVRGDGGYVVAAPSVHQSGNAYEWIDDREPLTMPEPVLALLEGAVNALPHRPDPQPETVSEATELSRYGQKALFEEAGKVESAVEGTRNDTLVRAAFKVGQLVPHEIPEDVARSVLISSAESCGLPRREAEKTTESGLSAGMDEARFPETQEATPAPSAVSAGRLQLRPASDFAVEQARFLWGNRLPIGELTLLFGQEGIGKSYITTAIAAAITNGTQLPDSQGQEVEGKVVMAVYEDSISKTVLPRLRSLGANEHLVHIIEMAEEEAFSPKDVPQLAEVLRSDPDIKLIVIDPVGSFVMDSEANSMSDIRRALSRLIAAAHETETAVLLVHHDNKSEYSNVLSKSAGSKAFTQVPRSVLTVWKDRTTDETFIGHIKHNLSGQAPAIEFGFDGSGSFAWFGVRRDVSPDRAYEEPERIPASKRDDAANWLRERLAHGQPMPSAYLIDQAKVIGITKRTLQRARKDVGARFLRTENGTDWQLPKEEQ